MPTTEETETIPAAVVSRSYDRAERLRIARYTLRGIANEKGLDYLPEEIFEALEESSEFLYQLTDPVMVRQWAGVESEN